MKKENVLKPKMHVLNTLLYLEPAFADFESWKLLIIQLEVIFIVFHLSPESN